MIKPPRVSIIILNWNGWRDSVECLKSLNKIAYSNFEVIVIDNGSTDKSVEMIKNFKRQALRFKLNLIENKENLGFAEGNNVAIRQILKEGDSDFILLLNNDTVVEKGFLAELIKTAQEKKEAGILGPKIYYYNFKGKKNVIQSTGSRINLFFGNFPATERPDKVDKRPFVKPKSVDFVTGACLLIKTEVVRKIGLLDKRFFLVFEDTDWCLRAKKAGYLILYVPRSIIWHKKSKTFQAKNVPQIYYYTRNLFWFEFKHANIFQLTCFLFNYFLFIFPKYFFGYLFIKKNYTLWKDYNRGVIAGISGWAKMSFKISALNFSD